ncbi:hypothetical protein FN846DRAFT_550626 [Sphaerosporella brunnea]|uniref:F-box domain-containing protein n=1 Tax=Sphaerosporella brunnea TaxID=1250544 RepID=A0A5J5EDV0_9PEZI|nr:hypothetical protein FN846DRAFT_550626 [Sphaerosporella brunnea]
MVVMAVISIYNGGPRCSASSTFTYIHTYIRTGKKQTHMASHVVDIPNFLLDHILLNLGMRDLLSARRVCRAWNDTILSRQQLRRKLFLQPPTIDTQQLRQPVALHPVLHRLQSNWGCPGVPILLTKPDAEAPLKPLAEVYGGELIAAEEAGEEGEEEEEGLDPEFTLHAVLLKDSPVKDHFATEPALTKFVITLPSYSLNVLRDDGVRVWDVAAGVKGLVEQIGKCREEDSWGVNCFARGGVSTLDGFRQTNRMLHDQLNRKFIALFRYGAGICLRCFPVCQPRLRLLTRQFCVQGVKRRADCIHTYFCGLYPYFRDATHAGGLHKGGSELHGMDP